MMVGFRRMDAALARRFPRSVRWRWRWWVGERRKRRETRDGQGVFARIGGERPGLVDRRAHHVVYARVRVDQRGVEDVGCGERER